MVGTMPLRDRSKTKDHVVPKSLGGTRTVQACSLCNRRKGNTSLEEFRAKSFVTSSEGVVEGALFYGEGGREWLS